MSTSRVALRSARLIARLKPCSLCQSRQIASRIYRNATKHTMLLYWLATGIRTQSYATKQRLDAPKLRTDIDATARLGFYTLNKQEGILNIEPHTALSIYDDFVAHKKTMPHSHNVSRIVEKYNIQPKEVTSLALVTFKIPDLSDPVKRAQLPPSPHKLVAGMLLQGCAQIGDTLAIVHILTAVYLGGSGDRPAQEIANLFPQKEIAQYCQSLDMIDLQSLEKTPGLVLDVLTLRGLFLERAGQKQQAKKLYQEAIKPSTLNYQPTSSRTHAMQLPLIAPWNALGYLLKADKDPKAKEEAKSYFQRGALEGDDPLSYFELAAFEPRTSEKWLQYTSKAAASGHRQAILNLTGFYQEVAAENSPILKSGSIRKVLNWVLTWRRGSAGALAREWLHAASVVGHKPSMLQLADYYNSIGDQERAREYLRQMVDSESAANHRDEAPQLVQVARKRLAGIQ